MTWIGRLHHMGKPNARARRVPSFVLAACLAVAMQADAAWLISRGSPQQLGVASGPLASKLSLAWKAKTGAPVTSSPVIDAERVYVGSKDGYVYAFARATGQRIWRFKTGGQVEAPPTVVGSRVVVGASDGYLYALDAATGKLGWKYETDGKILGAANAVPAARGTGTWLLVGSYDYQLHCVNAETGKPVWRYETGYYVNGTPAVNEGRVVLGGCDGMLYVLGLADGKLLRTIEIGSYIPGSVALAGRNAFIGHHGNRVVCVDVETGETRWSFRDRQFPYYAAPAVTDQFVVVAGQDKRVRCLTQGEGKQVWQFLTRGKIDSSPVIVDGKVVAASDDGRLYLLDLKDGRQLWTYEIGPEIHSSPGISNGMVFVGADDGFVYAFGAAR